MAAFHVLSVMQLWAGALWAGAVASAEVYSQNAICKQHNCINPLFPGLLDLSRLESPDLIWQCTTHRTVSSSLGFCKDAVMYDPALPSPNASTEVSTLVKAQDDAAATMFFYHLSGLGYESWDHQNPASDPDECVRSVWRMACFTYFPKVQAGCGQNQATNYLRPCSSACETYLATCAVECCDESARCVFQHSMGGSVLQTGYVESTGPSALCTGSGAWRGARPMWALPLACLLFGLVGSTAPAGERTERQSPRFSSMALAGALLVCALALQGCDVDVPQHSLGNWRAKSDYLVAFEYLPPGQPTSAAQLNSCMVPGAPATEQCSGHGFCREWNSESAGSNPLSFCICDREWADPECRTKRKSQTTAFLCSLFGGFLGIDYFYLGFPLWGIAKLLTLGGLGFWWLVDIVRTGSGPVYAQNFRVADDMPHWVFVLVTVAIFAALGFFVSIESYLSYRKRKREDVMKLQETEEARRLSRPDEMDGPRLRLSAGPRSFEGRHDFSGYGATLPAPHPNAGAPYAMQPGRPGAFAGQL
mmetsp:Transcript_24614/g.70801  ORF Transcript_24614/g.70801 Transcript_24614/m.70801 type:complete len:533 (-) Transcript_24614:36-1634(-)